MKVSEILKVKGNILYTVTPDTLLSEAINTMAEYDIGSLVVMESGELVGILTFREVLQALKVVYQHEKAERTHAQRKEDSMMTVRSQMDDSPMTITPDTEVNEVRRIMLERHARYVPVMEARTLLGVISFYDVAKAVLDAQGYENKMLKAYIRDWPVSDEGAS